MVTIFSKVKAELLTILNRELVDVGLASEVRTSRGYGTVQTPYVILTTRSYNERPSDEADLVFITIAVIAKFADAAAPEEALAETALDDIEQVLINQFGRDGLFQVHRPHWGAVDRDTRTWRPFSPIGPGYRYMECYFKFVV